MQKWTIFELFPNIERIIINGQKTETRQPDNALFQMCSDLKAEVESLKTVVKALVESNNKKSVAVKEVVENFPKFWLGAFIMFKMKVVYLKFLL